MTIDTDESLVARVASGDRAAYSALVNRHAGRYLALAERLLQNRQTAEDCVQDCFAKLWSQAGRFDPAAAKFTTWFHRIVINRCLDETRKVRPAQLADGFDMEDGRDGADGIIERVQTADAVQQALARLPDRQRAAVTLTYYDELKNAEAAEVLGLGIKAFESLLVRARAALAKDLRGFIRKDV